MGRIYLFSCRCQPRCMAATGFAASWIKPVPRQGTLCGEYMLSPQSVQVNQLGPVSRLGTRHAMTQSAVRCTASCFSVALTKRMRNINRTNRLLAGYRLQIDTCMSTTYQQLSARTLIGFCRLEGEGSTCGTLQHWGLCESTSSHRKSHQLLLQT